MSAQDEEQLRSVSQGRVARPLSLLMVGGGPGAFIGGIHRMAAALDGRWQLVGGAFSADAAKSKAFAATLGLAGDRASGSWQELLAGELARSPAHRADAVAIVTPNALHAEVTIAAMNAGIAVICDKPMTATLADAERIADVSRSTGVPTFVTYNYTGYPMVRAARHLIATGAIGTLRRIFVEYHQGWLATPLEGTGQKQASWRTDPAQSGGGCIGDIGSHAENLCTFVTNSDFVEVSARLSSIVPGRQVDDDAAIEGELACGARVSMTVSQICIGEQNNLRIRVHGDLGSLWWAQEQPNELKLADDHGTRILHRGENLAGQDHGQALGIRLPAGHPEGFVEAFATLYSDIASALSKTAAPAQLSMVHTADAGLRGVQFIDACQRSSKLIQPVRLGSIAKRSSEGA